MTRRALLAVGVTFLSFLVASPAGASGPAVRSLKTMCWVGGGGTSRGEGFQ